MSTSTKTEQHESQQQLEQLRVLLLGEDHEIVTRTLKKQAREVVTDVFTEALHDREKKDGSVNKVILPLVENAVEHSITHHSDRFISALYPLMGSLIRKSVSAFLADFMEKTNQLLENSLTLQGLKWRFSAWRAGVSFSQYIASQTYIYRVEHVFFIHHETGLLLRSVSLEDSDNSNADVISSMLSAINDFIGDSFQESPDGIKEQLQTVTTDNFNLLLKPGPNAILVAAVSGTPPQSLSVQLQKTIETLHTIYSKELNNFTGDSRSFDNADSLLRDCLLTEEKNKETKNNKTPWFAWLAISVVLIFIAFKSHHLYRLTQIEQELAQLDQEPGIMVEKVDVIDSNTITLKVLRDPEAITIENWLKLKSLNFTHLTLNEDLYLSLDPKLLNIKAKKIFSRYTDIQAQWINNVLTLTGDINPFSYKQLTTDLAQIGILNDKNLDVTQLNINTTKELNTAKALNQQAFQSLIGKISTIQLNFAIASDTITPSMTEQLSELAQTFLYLEQLADKLKMNVGLVIMGSSDNSGNIETNTKLSILRAINTEQTLSQLGLAKIKMFTSGLGQIDIPNVTNTSRKVMFNVIYVNTQEK
ncbi:OmpA family protein [Thalassotalea piscium]